jgi:hypothetical protein
MNYFPAENGLPWILELLLSFHLMQKIDKWVPLNSSGHYFRFSISAPWYFVLTLILQGEDKRWPCWRRRHYTVTNYAHYFKNSYSCRNILGIFLNFIKNVKIMFLSIFYGLQWESEATCMNTSDHIKRGNVRWWWRVCKASLAGTHS